MTLFWILLGCLAGVAALILGGAYICFRITFYSPPRGKRGIHDQEYPLPTGKVYEAYREPMIEWIKNARTLPHKEVSVTSFDGLTLRGRYYEFSPDAPIELLFHGYRGWAERDLSGGVARCHALGRSALIVDHRGSGESDGGMVTFGILERLDCRTWVDFIIKSINPNAKIILTGISMGASTVMLAASQPMPPNVVGVLADCGYTSARAIIQKVMRDMKLPAPLLYPLVKLGARIYGKFDPDEDSSIESMRRCQLPVFFIHGDTDDFVP